MPNAPRFRPWQGRVWRCIESQFRAATARITDSNDEQALLEDILEETKPPMPAPCRALHYTFGAAFRYGAYPRDSRFRRKGPTPGVYYASDEAITAVCETLWYRFAFFAASPETPLPRDPVEHTLVAAEIASQAMADLTRPPLKARSGDWTHPTDYSACLAFADEARAGGVTAIRYASVRDPDARGNVAVLSCEAFAAPQPTGWGTWRFLFTTRGARVFDEAARRGYEVHPEGTRLAWGLRADGG